MLKVCKYSLYNCQHVSELSADDDDENPASSCTSSLQMWHQPRVEGISSQPVMEVVINKTHTQAKKTGTGVTCQLYEARRTAWTDLSKFLEKITEIDPTCGLAHSCEINNTDNSFPQDLAIAPQDHLAHISR